MSDKLDKIRELAKAKAAAELHVSSLGRMNVPTDPEKRIQSDAVYRMSVGYRDGITKLYDEAMAALTIEELRELSGIKETT